MVKMFELVDAATKNELRALMEAKFLVRSYQTRLAEKKSRQAAVWRKPAGMLDGGADSNGNG